METYTAKQALRKDMASRKKEYSRITLCELSDKIMDRLEQTELFQAASCIALYHAIRQEPHGTRKGILRPPSFHAQRSQGWHMLRVPDDTASPGRATRQENGLRNNRRHHLLISPQNIYLLGLGSICYLTQ